ncbi:hypothetical protein AB8A31_16080 [Tardiphaga sp. 804_B3_N1_9]|uniref:hypothetical protein n=1 Tax=Tardiphaga TaxID=1395974 RepID=UPI001586F30C|nr:hypothetical protein [Tardiphaga robiniae]NUU42681.1 hypothetical protein [Tardiphaga robiniae]
MKLLAGSMKAVDETGETIVRAASTNTGLILRSALFARVSKDGGTLGEPASWFETAQMRLLTMRDFDSDLESSAISW